jgi:hypothetical protein
MTFQSLIFDAVAEPPPGIEMLCPAGISPDPPMRRAFAPGAAIAARVQRHSRRPAWGDRDGRVADRRRRLCSAHR